MEWKNMQKSRRNGNPQKRCSLAKLLFLSNLTKMGHEGKKGFWGCSWQADDGRKTTEERDS